MRKLIIQTVREGYATNQIRHTMTVGELKELLENYYNDELPVYLSFDNGYTYGGITEQHLEEIDDEEEV